VLFLELTVILGGYFYNHEHIHEFFSCDFSCNSFSWNIPLQIHSLQTFYCPTSLCFIAFNKAMDSGISHEVDTARTKADKKSKPLKSAERKKKKPPKAPGEKGEAACLL
jgi:hypothetical protein